MLQAPRGFAFSLARTLLPVSGSSPEILMLWNSVKVQNLTSFTLLVLQTHPVPGSARLGALGLRPQPLRADNHPLPQPSQNAAICLVGRTERRTEHVEVPQFLQKNGHQKAAISTKTTSWWLPHPPRCHSPLGLSWQGRLSATLAKAPSPVQPHSVEHVRVHVRRLRTNAEEPSPSQS